MEQGNYRPSFCSIFYPEIHSHQLKICPAFCKRYLRVNTASGLCTLMFLMGPDGRQWKVRLLQSEGHFFFAEGWEEFNIFHCLIVGDFLTFEYDRYKSCFHVLIYDVTGCEKKIQPRKDLQPYKPIVENDDVLVLCNANSPVLKVVKQEEEEDDLDRQHQEKEVNRNVGSKKNKRIRVQRKNNRDASLGREKKRKRKEVIKKDVDSKKNKRTKAQKKDDSGAVNLGRANKGKRKKQVDRKKSKTQRAQKKTNSRASANLCRANKMKKKEEKHKEEKVQQNVDITKNKKTRPQKKDNNKATKHNAKMMLVTTGKDAINIKKAQAEANSFQSKHPYFVVIKLSRTAYRGIKLRVPHHFAKAHIPKRCGMRLKIKKKRKIWPVNLISYKSGGHTRKDICGGWRKFVNDNNLEKDGALVFEMVKPNEFVVHIFRLMEDY